MDTTCPTCGQPLKTNAGLLGPEAIMHLLTAAQPKRELYRGQNGGWYVTYGGGEADPDAVRALIRNGKVQSVYNNCPEDAYHVGQTLDMDRTMAARKAGSKRLFYVGDHQ